MPRLFECVTQTDSADYDPEFLFSKLSYAEWLTWPLEERIVIEQYLSALWQQALAKYPMLENLPSFADIEQVLDSIVITGFHIAPLLAAWEAMDEEPANRHLVQFVTMFGADFADGCTLDFGWWESSEQAAGVLRTWLLQTAVLNRVVENMNLVQIDGFEHLFEPALATLQQEADTH
ncbi:MAG: hypothetical protein V4734_07660 [Terriglobus sp.]